jgi:hypothetical protein
MQTLEKVDVIYRYIFVLVSIVVVATDSDVAALALHHHHHRRRRRRHHHYRICIHTFLLRLPSASPILS